MSKKWSQKTEKTTLVNDDEFMILDSEDATAATKNKWVKISSLLNNGPNTFSFQTVGATTEQQAYIFNGALSISIWIAAANSGNTKGLAAQYQINCTVTNSINTINVNLANDFGSANVSIVTAANSLTITLNGQAGETINWKGNVFVVTI